VGNDVAALRVIVSEPAGTAVPVEGTGGELVAEMEPLGEDVAAAVPGSARTPPARAIATAQNAAATTERPMRSTMDICLLNGPSPFRR
ncbi:MAG: hypothetical protein ACYCU6_10565, partial [Acidimicrobiales bacterium]